MNSIDPIAPVDRHDVASTLGAETLASSGAEPTFGAEALASGTKP